MTKETFLSAQLRESAPYLREAGSRQTADLLMTAAAEIESLRNQVKALHAVREDSASPEREGEMISRRRKWAS